MLSVLLRRLPCVPFYGQFCHASLHQRGGKVATGFHALAAGGNLVFFIVVYHRGTAILECRAGAKHEGDDLVVLFVDVAPNVVFAHRCEPFAEVEHLRILDGNHDVAFGVDESVFAFLLDDGHAVVEDVFFGGAVAVVVFAGQYLFAFVVDDTILAFFFHGGKAVAKAAGHLPCAEAFFAFGVEIVLFVAPLHGIQSVAVGEDVVVDEAGDASAGEVKHGDEAYLRVAGKDTSFVGRAHYQVFDGDYLFACSVDEAVPLVLLHHGAPIDERVGILIYRRQHPVAFGVDVAVFDDVAVGLHSHHRFAVDKAAGTGPLWGNDFAAGGVVEAKEILFSGTDDAFVGVGYLFEMAGQHLFAATVDESVLVVVGEHNAETVVKLIHKFVLGGHYLGAVLQFEAEESVALGGLYAIDEHQFAAAIFVVHNDFARRRGGGALVVFAFVLRHGRRSGQHKADGENGEEYCCSHGVGGVGMNVVL